MLFAASLVKILSGIGAAVVAVLAFLFDVGDAFIMSDHNKK